MLKIISKGKVKYSYIKCPDEQFVKCTQTYTNSLELTFKIYLEYYIIIVQTCTTDFFIYILRDTNSYYQTSLNTKNLSKMKKEMIIKTNILEIYNNIFINVLLICSFSIC